MSNRKRKIASIQKDYYLEAFEKTLKRQRDEYYQSSNLTEEQKWIHYIDLFSLIMLTFDSYEDVLHDDIQKLTEVSYLGYQAKATIEMRLGNLEMAYETIIDCKTRYGVYLNNCIGQLAATDEVSKLKWKIWDYWVTYYHEHNQFDPFMIQFIESFTWLPVDQLKKETLPLQPYNFQYPIWNQIVYGANNPFRIYNDAKTNRFINKLNMAETLGKCCVCKEEDMQLIPFDCQHRVCAYKCYHRFVIHNDNCPVCRIPISDVYCHHFKRQQELADIEQDLREAVTNRDFESDEETSTYSSIDEA